MNNWFALLLSLALIIRLVIAPFFDDGFDFYIWIDVGKMLVVNHANPYDVVYNRFYYFFSQGKLSEIGGYVYFPLWMLIVTQSYLLYSLFPLGGLFLHFLIKLPLILADLITGYLIYIVMLERMKSKRIALISFTYFVLNPLVILISAWWGMFDSLCALFSIIALATFEKHPRLSAISLGLAIITKFYPCVLLPVFILKSKKRILYLVYALTPAVLLSIPFLIWNPKSYLIATFWYQFARKPEGSWWSLLSLISAIAAWSVKNPHAEFVVKHYLESSPIPLLVFIIGYLATYTFYSKEDLWTLTSIVAISFLFLSKNVHPPFFIWVLPFFCLRLHKGRLHMIILSSLFLILVFNYLHFFSISEGVDFIFQSTRIKVTYIQRFIYRSLVREVIISFLGVGSAVTAVHYVYVKMRTGICLMKTASK